MGKHTHPYIPNSLPEIKREMMREMGIKSINELYADIPEKYRLKKLLNLPDALSEFEVKTHVESLLSKNKTCSDMPVFLGAGCWPHYVPAAVKEIVQRSELLTSYTPYQPEISHGMLQALFEYQSMICELTGMEVANCSMYDWASALGEAARMASRLTRRSEILIPKIIHPERAATLHVYDEPAGLSVKQIAYNSETGQISLEDLRSKISDKTAAVYIENPSYLGFIETQVYEISKEIHEHGALFIVGVDPTSLGILKPPGEYDADIVVGEAQSLGNSMNFGGPLLGIFACRDDLKLIRQMPGRIIGMTTTLDGSRQGFCMALQTREQHIRREKATSNICSNEALCAVAAAVYMSLLGPEGLRELGETIMYKANYAIHLLSKINGVKTPVFKSAHFKEFTVNFDGTDLSVKKVHEKLLQCGIHDGKDVSKEFPELGKTALYCVTEIHSEEDIERLAATLEEILIGR
ncbi:MAG: aminomethyl-transferring glycine dehydrogenase subunit GcvPA [Candidatus Bathyarchaeia archaeon]|nr:aminomethyl-transferring glycine dehydrogenase subunit GcvPA [Candidatus Bathyarchaeia archaeon]MDI6904266.1 aminomethyl-transferring glycine dehydrogenase subunit GcvPA [Candidatus Bathyarchaeia archaeon]